jgi:signal transduction histidine kinase
VAALVMAGATAWRRTSPVACTAVVYAAALLRILAGVPVVLPGDFVVAWSLWSVTVHGPARASRAALAWAMVGSAVLAGAAAATGTDPAVASTLGILAALVLLTTWSAATARRARRAAIEALQDRARRLEVERDQQAQLAAAAERARIAREMHDIVAHSLTVIVAQADGGRYAAAADPAAAQQALAAIAATGRAALRDVRGLLGVLRTGPDADPSGATAPLPGLADLDDLVAGLRAGGLRVDLSRSGAPRPVPQGLGLALYRIAQEALTNVLKHAGPGPSVQVSVQWLPDRVALEVVDDGRGAAAAGDGRGQGLAGLGERAALFGGQLQAGPRAGGGFGVRAVLPTGPAAREVRWAG